MKKKRKHMDLFLLPGIPTDKDLEGLADALLGVSRRQKSKRSKRAASLSEDSAGSAKPKDGNSKKRSESRLAKAHRSS